MAEHMSSTLARAGADRLPGCSAIPVSMSEQLARNMKEYPFSNESFCGHFSDLAYVPRRVREKCLQEAKWALSSLQRFSMFLPTIPRLLGPMSKFEFLESRYIWVRNSTRPSHVLAKFIAEKHYLHPVKLLPLKHGEGIEWLRAFTCSG